MKHTVSIREEFGSFCADGEAALRFRQSRVDPYVDLADEIELDFSGVRNANSSFCNALIAGLIVRHSPEVIKKLRLAHCRENLKVLLSAAMQLGISRWRREGSPTVTA